MSAEYKTIAYYSKDDQAYIIFAPDLPGCFADGQTIEEAHENILQTIDEWKEFANELGREIPAPLTKLESTGASVFDVARYILGRTGPISTMALQKLVYYCDAWALAWFQTPLFKQGFEAWKRGPVCRELFERHKGRFVVSSDDFNESHELSLSECRLIDDVLSVYKDEDSEWLSELTHSENPWKETRGTLPDDANSRKRIDPVAIEKYYRSMVL